MFNDVFVSGLPVFVGLPVHPQWSRSLQYARAIASIALVPVVGASCFPIFK